MTALPEGGAAPRITERLRPVEIFASAIDAQSGPTLRIEFRSSIGRQPLQNIFEIGLEVAEFFFTEDVLENVETVMPLGVDDGGIDLTRRHSVDRSPIVEGQGARFPFGHIGR